MLQWNTNKGLARGKKIDGVLFAQLLIEHSVHIALLQELSAHFQPPAGFTLYTHDTHNPHTGILIQDTLTHTLDAQLTFSSAPLPDGNINFRAQGLTVHPPNSAVPLRLCSFYRRPTKQDPEAAEETTRHWLDQAMADCGGTEAILAGDLNGKHSKWSPAGQSDRMGKTVATMIDHHPHIQVANIPGTATRGPSLGSNQSHPPTGIDITLASLTRHQIVEWKVLPQEDISDHFPILIKIQCPPSNSHTKSEQSFFSKPAWKDEAPSMFRDMMESRAEQLEQLVDEAASLDEAVDILTGAIVQAAREFGVIRTRSLGREPKSPSNRFWSETCAKLQTDKRYIERQLVKARKRNAAPAAIKKLQELREDRRRDIKRELTALQRDSWQGWTSQLRVGAPSEEVWGQLHAVSQARLKREHLRPPSNIHLQVDGHYILAPKDRADKIAEFFSNIHSPRVPSSAEAKVNVEAVNHHIASNHLGKPPPTSVRLLTLIEIMELTPDLPPSEGTAEALSTPFTMLEMESSLKTCKPFSSPGEDLLGYALLQSLPERIMFLWWRIINSSWLQGYVPPAWKRANIIPLPKVDTPKSPGDYRPISLLSCTGKWVEKMINKRLSRLAEGQTYFAKSQFGFRAGYSADLQSARVVHHAHQAWSRGNGLLVLFLDIQKAFDTVWHNGLIFKLHTQLGIRGSALQWLSHFLHGRSARVQVEGVLSDPFELACGVPQGSALSPFLFNVYINDFPKSIPKGIIPFQFADDTGLGKEFPLTPRAAELGKPHFQKAIDKAVGWFQVWLMGLNTKKTEVRFLSPPGFDNVRKVLTFTMDKDRVSALANLDDKTGLVKGSRYLGVHVDNHLTMTHHMAIITKRFAMRVSILKCLAGTKWGGDILVLRRLYTMWARPVIEYAAPLLMLATPEDRGKLDQLQAEAMRTILGTNHMVSVRALEIESGIPPLGLRRIILCGNLGRRILSNEASPAFAEWRQFKSTRNDLGYPVTPRGTMSLGARPKLFDILHKVLELATVHPKRTRFQNTDDWAKWDPKVLQPGPSWKYLPMSAEDSNKPKARIPDIVGAHAQAVGPHGTLFFTDGWTTGTGLARASGSAAMSYSSDNLNKALHSMSQRGEGSNHPRSAKLEGILLALTNVRATGLASDRPPCLAIMTNSIYCIKAIMRHNGKTKRDWWVLTKIQESITAIISKGGKIWIASIHHDLVSHQLKQVSELAKKASLLPPHQTHTISHNQEAKHRLEEASNNLWQRWWDNHTKSGQKYKALQPLVVCPPLPHHNNKGLVFDREAQVLISRIRLGNCSHNRHLCLLGLIASAECDQCQARDSAEHRIVHCPGYTLHRATLESTLEKWDSKLTPQGLPQDTGRQDTNVMAYVALVKFLKDTTLNNLFIWRPGSPTPIPAAFPSN